MEKKKTEEKNIHAGHRKRLTDLAINAGVDAMSDVQVLEFFLSYIFPRGDTNPLAHRLLERFETFTQIIEADINDLKSVSGINDRSAKMISMFGELFYYYATSKMGRKYVVGCRAEIISVIEDCLRFRTSENMILLALSPGNIITHKRRISNKNSSSVSISVLDLTNFIASAKPASLVIAHCHPYGRAMPSENDGEAFKLVESICTTCGVNFIDSYIVGEDGVYSQRDNKLVRTYYDIDQLKTALKSVMK